MDKADWFLVGLSVGAFSTVIIWGLWYDSKCNTRAVANGCAIRVLDSASGEVKTVWKDGKP